MYFKILCNKTQKVISSNDGQFNGHLSVFFQWVREHVGNISDIKIVDGFNGLCDEVSLVDNKSNNIDYRELLKKYIGHVGEMEGISFIYRTYTAGLFGDSISPEEWDELRKCDKETNNS